MLQLIFIMITLLGFPLLGKPCETMRLAQKSHTYDWHNFFDITLSGQVKGKAYLCFYQSLPEKIDMLGFDNDETAIRYYKKGELYSRKFLLHQDDLSPISQMFIRNAPIISIKLDKEQEDQEKRKTYYEFSTYFLRKLAPSLKPFDTRFFKVFNILDWEDSKFTSKVKFQNKTVDFDKLEINTQSRMIAYLKFYYKSQLVLTINTSQLRPI